MPLSLTEYNELLLEDPLPRRGFSPGDVVLVSVDAYGLCGRDPHPPVTRVSSGRISSPCEIGVVAHYDPDSNIEWEGADAWTDYAHPNDYYYVATNAGYYVFAHYELTLTYLGNLANLNEPYCLPATPEDH